MTQGKHGLSGIKQNEQKIYKIYWYSAESQVFSKILFFVAWNGTLRVVKRKELSK